jgi:hypothetical protein
MRFLSLLGILLLFLPESVLARKNRALIRESVRGQVQQISLEETTTRTDRRRQYLRECRRYHEVFSRNNQSHNGQCPINGDPNAGDEERPAYGFFGFVGHLFKPNQFSCNDLLYLNGEGESVTNKDICACHQCSGGFKVFLQKGVEVFNRDEDVLKEFINEMIGEMWQEQLAAHFDRMVYFDILQERGILPNNFLLGLTKCRLGATYDSSSNSFNLDGGILGGVNSLNRDNDSSSACPPQIYKSRLPYLLNQEPSRRFNPQRELLSFGENFVRVARLTDNNLIPADSFGLPSMTNACLPPKGFRRMNYPPIGSDLFSRLYYNSAPDLVGQGLDRTRSISSSREFFQDLHYRNSLDGLSYQQYLTRMDFTQQFSGDRTRSQMQLSEAGFQEYQASSDLLRNTLNQDPLFILIQGLGDEQIKLELTSQYYRMSKSEFYKNKLNVKQVQDALNESCIQLSNGEGLQKYLCNEEMPEFSAGFISAHIIPRLNARFGTKRGERLARLLSRQSLCEEDREGFNTYTERTQNPHDAALERVLNPDKIVNSTLRHQLTERQATTGASAQDSRANRTPYEKINEALCGTIFPEGCRLEEGQAASPNRDCGTPETWRTSLQTHAVPTLLALIKSYPSPSNPDDDTEIERLQRFLRSNGVTSPPTTLEALEAATNSKVAELLAADPQSLLRYTLRSDEASEAAETAQAYLSLAHFLNSSSPQAEPLVAGTSTDTSAASPTTPPTIPQTSIAVSQLFSSGPRPSTTATSVPVQGNYMIISTSEDQTALDTYAATIASAGNSSGAVDAITSDNSFLPTVPPPPLPYQPRDPFYVEPPAPPSYSSSSFTDSTPTSTSGSSVPPTVVTGAIIDPNSNPTTPDGTTGDPSQSDSGTSSNGSSGSLLERGLGLANSTPGSSLPNLASTSTTNGTPSDPPTSAAGERSPSPSPSRDNSADDPYLRELEDEREELNNLLADYDEMLNRFNTDPQTPERPNSVLASRSPTGPHSSYPSGDASDDGIFQPTSRQNPLAVDTNPTNDDLLASNDDWSSNDGNSETLGSFIQRLPDQFNNSNQIASNSSSSSIANSSTNGAGKSGSSGQSTQANKGRAPASIGASSENAGISSIKDSLKRGKNLTSHAGKESDLDPLEEFEEFLGIPAIKANSRHFSYELDLLLPHELFSSFSTDSIVRALGLEGMFFSAVQVRGTTITLYLYGFNPENLPWENFQTKEEVERLMKLKNIIQTLKSMEDPKAEEELQEIGMHTKLITRFDLSKAQLSKLRGKFISKSRYKALIDHLSR